MNRSVRRSVGLLAVITLALAACTSAATPSPVASTGAGAGGAAGVTVGSATSATLGVYLTGSDGKTLYILTKDSPNTTTCTGSCAQNWPALTVAAGGSAQAGAGVTGTFATMTRPDGATQVTHNGMPLYYFAGDTKAGDTNGQGVGGVWFVATPTGGGPTGGGNPTTAPASTPGGYNY